MSIKQKSDFVSMVTCYCTIGLGKKHGLAGVMFFVFNFVFHFFFKAILYKIGVEITACVYS